MIQFLSFAGAVLLANLLTVCFVHAAWSIGRQEKNGQEPRWVNLGLFALPLVFLLGVLYLNGALEATPLRHLMQPETPELTRSLQYPGTP